MNTWKNALQLAIDISVLTKTLPTKGNLVYEYNPFRNYRLTKDMYEYKDRLYSEEDLKDKCGIEWCEYADLDSEGNPIDIILDINKMFLEKPKTEEELENNEETSEENNSEKEDTYKNSNSKGQWILSNSKVYEEITKENGEENSSEKETIITGYKFKYKVLDSELTPLVRLKGELIDFDTTELNFDLNHPVNIIPQYSYDGSVNLILNDGKNSPRLINSRFSTTGKNTYEIVDRKGSNDTNIYDLGEQFDTDTSLYKRVKQIPKLKLLSVDSGGVLKCGNYHFYFKLLDSDGNETDYVAESGLVSIFIGSLFPQSIYTGNKNENTNKLVTFLLSNIDPSYNYVSVYYSRYTAEDGENRVTFYKKIDRKFVINNTSEARILINGLDEEIDVTLEEINLSYNIIDSANCATTALSMLFMGNVHKPNIAYEELQDLSLRFLPYLKNKDYELDINEDYNIQTKELGYYSPIYIYNNVGYWNKEIYRLGIVYILSNGELSSVFNIRGRENIEVFKGDTKDNKEKIVTSYDSLYSHFNFKNELGEQIRIKYNESNYLISPPEKEEGTYAHGVQLENIKGVVSLNSSEDTRKIHAFEIRVEPETIERLKQLGIKGYFFVRQSRMPLTLVQGITIGIDKTGRVPTIPAYGGILQELSDEIDGNDDNYVETEDATGINYLSEGFLSRYRFKFVKKGSSIFSKIGKIALISGIVVAAVAGTIITGGTLTVAAAATYATIAAATAATAALTMTAVGLIDETVKGLERLSTHKKRKLEGRNTKRPSGYNLVERDESRLLGASFKDRLIIKDSTKNEVGAILCPDYDVAPQYYNLLFTGQEFTIKTTLSQKEDYRIEGEKETLLELYNIRPFTNNSENFRHFYNSFKSYSDTDLGIKHRINSYVSKLLAIPDDVACVTIGKVKFRSKAGTASEAWKYEYIGEDFKSVSTSFSQEEDETVVLNSTDSSNLTDSQVKDEIHYKEINTDIVRGSYGPYIAMTDYSGIAGETVSIMIPGYLEGMLKEYFQIRMQDVSPFYAISDRIDINNLEEYYIQNSNLKNDSNIDNTCVFELFRGDCYICQFTHRLNRNFNDESAPYNSIIVDSKSWKEHYKIEKSEEFSKINAGDVNAVDLGMWVTFTVRSTRNLNIRSLDRSVVAETAMMGHPRGFYPYHGMIAEGSYKSAEALVYNDGFAKNLSERFNFTLPDSPYIKNWYGTRIMYSDIHINDGYKNGFRVFLGKNYRDYTRLYGEIVKLLNYGENLFVVFEHGLALIPINERAIAAQGAGGMAYINTSNVLPENPNIISESYGSIWPDSVIITPQDGENPTLVYGVDTVAKKIWMFDGSLHLISDFKVQEFLNLNLTLTERENEPILGIRNVKTFYNAYKHDVMFTFYDDLSTHEEKVWNLCYNTKLLKFITFYSWVPSYMENINNIPFSFNRNVSKWIAKLGQTHADNSFAEGIVLNNNIYNNDGTIDAANYIKYKYLTKSGEYNTKKVYFNQQGGLIGVFNLMDHILPSGENVDFFVKFELARDIYGYYNYFTIKLLGTIKFAPEDNAKFENNVIPIYGLYFKEEKPEYSNYTSEDGNSVYTITSFNKNFHFSELYYRNKAGHEYNDYDDYKVTREDIDPEHCTIELDLLSNSLKLKLNDLGIDISTNIKLTKDNYFTIVQALDLPIFHSRDGNRPSLPEEINKKDLVQLLNIKATIYAKYTGDKEDESYVEFMHRMKADSNERSTDVEYIGWVNSGTYESSIAITSKWNLLFLDTSFWKHGQAGVIDIKEDIYPTKWYGEQHPFEFEVIVVNDPGVHKIFLNLEIVSNKAKPESFHFEVIGDSYDFAKDKPNMYFRQEARKALFLYNGCSITYDKNFRKINPKLLPKSAELVYNYYERLDTLEDIYDKYHLKGKPYPSLESASYYNSWASLSPNKDYRHLSGGEIVYYPNRQEYRVWNHLPAIDADDFPQDSSQAILRANCRYLEDRWRVTINPLLICYKNEYVRRKQGALCQPENSTWPFAMNVDYSKSKTRIPPITIRNTNLPTDLKETVIKKLDGNIYFPDVTKHEGKDNALYGLYSFKGEFPIDNTNWLNDLNVYKMNFGEAQNRKEADIRDKFVKVRIRYSGEELAVIDFLNTIYTISYA